MAVGRLVARRPHAGSERKVRATQSITFLNGKLWVTAELKVTENDRRVLPCGAAR